MIKKTAAAGLTAIVVACASSAAQAQQKLVVHHFLGPKAPAHAKFIAPWAQRVMEASGGELEIEIFPAMSLGGAPPSLYRQLRDGTVDIVWTVIGYTPGVFPRTEVFELPSVHGGNARATNLAIADIYDEHLAEDFTDVHPLLVHTHAGNALHLVDSANVDGVSDLRGLKLRTPSRTGGWLIEAWQAEPVGMPLPALPQALTKGTVEGALIPFEVVIPMKVHELTKYSISGNKRFGTSVFLFAMNKERYESLPPKLRAVIDAHSGRAVAAEYGDLWDSIEEPGRQAQLKSGGELKNLAQTVMAELDQRSASVEERWVEEANKAGLSGSTLVRAAKEAVSANAP